MPILQLKTRFVESFPGRCAAALLLLMWLASMSCTDSNAYSMLPFMGVTVVVALLAALGWLAGYAVPRLTWLNVLSLAAAAYFLWRAANSYAVVEARQEMANIALAALFYVAGAYAATARRHPWLTAALHIAVLLNLAAFAAMQLTDLPMEWLGRPAVGLSGPNSRPVSLFVYKNFAGSFLLLSSFLLLWRVAAVGKMRWVDSLSLLTGLAGLAVSFCCNSRTPLGLLALLLPFSLLLLASLRSFSGKKVSAWLWLACVLCLLVALVLVCGGLLGGDLLSRLSVIDTHERASIWKAALRVAQGSGLLGCGARASEWEMIPYYSEWFLPNFVHNEYLQCWLDYGVVGISLLFVLLVAHLGAGLAALGREGVDEGFRRLVATALLLLAAMLLLAFVDFSWHQSALLSMTSFAAGVLAAPSAYQRYRLPEGRHGEPRRELVPLKRQGFFGRLLLLSAAASLVYVLWPPMLSFLPAWKAQWRYAALCKAGATAEERCCFLADILPQYPDSGVMDHYMSVDFQKPQRDWQRNARLLESALQANPKQLYTVTMLADAYTRLFRFADAEALLRASYPADGPKASMLNNWPYYYGFNLLKWGRWEMLHGRPERALSLLDYALKMDRQSRLVLELPYRQGVRELQEKDAPRRTRAYLDLCRADRDTLRAIGLQADDSWKCQDPRHCGKRPLYCRFVEEDGE